MPAAAMEILRRRYIDGDAERLASLEEERLHARVARRIYDLRTRAGLTQAELAARVDTTQSAISRLEDADYEGHSLRSESFSKLSREERRALEELAAVLRE